MTTNDSTVLLTNTAPPESVGCESTETVPIKEQVPIEIRSAFVAEMLIVSIVTVPEPTSPACPVSVPKTQ